MRKLLIIIAILMMSSLAAAEPIAIAVETDVVYKFYSWTYESLDNADPIDTTEEIGEGKSVYYFDLVDGNYLYVAVDVLMEDIEDYLSDIKIRVQTADEVVFFLSQGSTELGYIMGY